VTGISKTLEKIWKEAAVTNSRYYVGIMPGGKAEHQEHFDQNI
jgi:hypothetical protein